MHRRALNTFFILPALLFIGVFAFFAFYYPKGVPELWMNEHSHLYADKFFLYATEGGHGLFYATVIFVLLFVHVGFAATTFFGGLLCSITTGVLKQIVFGNSPRPPKFFEGMHLHFVQGSEILYQYSFPSGHTMAAFTLTFLLAHLFQKKEWGIPLALFAFSIGLSRVYLLKHFFVDVFTGASIGLVIALLMYYFILPIAGGWNYKLTRKGFVRISEELRVENGE